MTLDTPTPQFRTVCWTHGVCSSWIISPQPHPSPGFLGGISDLILLTTPAHSKLSRPPLWIANCVGWWLGAEAPSPGHNLALLPLSEWLDHCVAEFAVCKIRRQRWHLPQRVTGRSNWETACNNTQCVCVWPGTCTLGNIYFIH